jgi:hypothetical protein
MTDLEKPKTARKKKPPTQTAGVNGIDGHRGMGAAPEHEDLPAKKAKPTTDWFRLVKLPAFEMFVRDQSGFDIGSLADEWVKSRRLMIGDSGFYEQYALWHKEQGLWLNESPVGEVLNDD